ncbi:MAG: pilus assembly protein PilP [Rhodocyclaceae bacterium]|jgi:type IV pilus assembly protein PilP|nr:pilus assembly protein PilP [Rhodocyclaceae bacterium]
MKRTAAILIACLGLAACGGEEHQDLKQWMKEATKDLKGRVPPLPEIKPFPVIAYDAADLVDPFRPSRIEPEKKAGTGGIQPDLNRRKEALEAYPLESLKMVGTIRKDKMVHALIQADRNVHQVKIGNYMGQNFGIVANITETEISLRELVPDSLGDYSERTSTLQLQEKQQEGKK